METAPSDSRPLGFVFTCAHLRGPTGDGSTPAARTTRRELIDRILPDSLTENTQVFALADEVHLSADSAAQGVVVGIPAAVRKPDSGYTGTASFELSWHAVFPDRTEQLLAALGTSVHEDTAHEPLIRVGSALEEAFADARVNALSRIRGLMPVVTLLPLDEKEMHEAGPGEAHMLEPEYDLVRRLWAILAEPPGRDRLSDAQTLEWPSPLFSFQQDGVQAMLRMERLLLADDMGLGKTIQALAAMRVLKARGHLRRALIVCPTSVQDQWRREIEKWAPELSAIIVRGTAEDRTWQWRAERDVTICSYDIVRADPTPAPGGNQASWDVVILDEAQRIKNRNYTSESVKKIPRRRSWALTGTPVENREDDLASIMEFVDHSELPYPKRYRPGQALRLRHRELQIRRKKSEVLDELPEKLETTVTIQLHSDQQASYQKAEREGIVYLKSLGAEVTVRHVLELITRLKQICNADPETGASSKLEDIRNRLWELSLQGHKGLIFSQYVGETSGVRAASRYLHEFNPVVLTGDMPVDEREQAISRFRSRDNHHAMVISLRAGALGLNLQEASYVFHLDRWWNPAVEQQAEDRTHRIGQTVKVNVIKYVCIGTVEERIERVLNSKRAIFRELIDDVSVDLSSFLDRREMLGLFGLE